MLLAQHAYAAEIRLFRTNGGPVSDYDAALSRITPGTRVLFSHGVSFVVGERLGAGRTTLIFALNDSSNGPSALRVPLDPSTCDFIDHFVAGLSRLTLVPQQNRVGLYGWQSGEYAVVDRIPNGERLDFFFRRIQQNVQGQHYTPEDQFKVDALLRFVRGFAQYAEVGDFGFDQVKWSGDHWVLIDIAQTLLRHHTRRATAIRDSHIFESHAQLPPAIAPAALEIIHEVRREAHLPDTSIRTIMSGIMDRCVRSLLGDLLEEATHQTR